MKILAIGAHPDDIEVGCSGTLAKYVQAGHEIYLLVMTEGHMGGKRAVRKKEQMKSAKILNPRELIWGGCEDTLLSLHMNKMVHDIEAVLKKIAPDFIFVQHEDDTHQDHRALAKATISATRYVRNVLFYEGPTTQNFSPTVFVDIKETIDTKFATLLAHRSQVQKTNIGGLSITISSALPPSFAAPRDGCSLRRPLCPCVCLSMLPRLYDPSFPSHPRSG